VLVIALILGVPVAIGIGVVRATAFNSAITSLDRQPLVQANNQLVETFRQFDTTARACTTVSCLEQADAMLSQQLGDFVRSVQSAGDRGVDAAVVAQTISAAQNAQSATEAMTGGGSTLSEYQSLAARVQLVQRLQALAQAQQQFAAAVNS
jgi:hypothetical protein